MVERVISVASLISFGGLGDAPLARQSLASWPVSIDLRLLLAAALVDDGKAEEAVSIAEGAVASAPDLARAHELLGWSLHNAGRYEEGSTPLRLAVDLEPMETNTRVVLAENLLRHRSSWDRSSLSRVSEARFGSEALGST